MAPGRAFGLYSLLVDPAQVWRHRIRPFTDGGDPAFDLLSSAARSGLRMAAFPFTAEGQVIHRGSVAAVFAAADQSHALYDWVTGHHDPHFGEFLALTSDTRLSCGHSANRRDTYRNVPGSRPGYPPSHP